MGRSVVLNFSGDFLIALLVGMMSLNLSGMKLRRRVMMGGTAGVVWLMSWELILCGSTCRQRTFFALGESKHRRTAMRTDSRQTAAARQIPLRKLALAGLSAGRSIKT